MQKDYTVLVAQDLDQLIFMVNSWLSQGWQCQGGVFIYQSINNKPFYYQAIIKWG